MSEHYFTNEPTSKHENISFEINIRDRHLRFISDSGVFSKNYLDRGTEILIQNAPIKDGLKILDLGCGYGPIGITAAKINKTGHIDMVDINKRAVELAHRNAALNNVGNVSFYTGDGYGPINENKYDLILTNPPIRAGKKVIYGFIRDALTHLESNGKICVVIKTRQGAKSMKSFMEQTFGNVETAAIESGYRVLSSTKKS